MAAIDFTKGVDFSPLERLGVEKQEAMNLLAAMAPVIDLEFQKKIDIAFSDDERKIIGEEAQAQGIKPEEGMYFLEEKYHAKTGRYFMEEMRLLFNEYVHHAANILSQARRDMQTFSDTGSENATKFDELVKNEQWEEAAKLFDEVLTDKLPRA